MSKDFTPAEQYMADKAIKQMTGTALRDCDITWKIEGQTKTSVQVADWDVSLTNPQAKEQYPELSFLYGDFKSQYERYENDKDAQKVFAQLEEALVKVEQQFEKNHGENVATGELQKLTGKELANEPAEKVVQEWFYGKLDPHFYYSEENNDKLFGYIENQIKNSKEQTKSNKKDVKTAKAEFELKE